MPVVKAKELKNIKKEELDKKLKELRTELMKENAQIATGTIPKNPGNVRNIKKNIARILTVINQKPKEVKK